MHGTISSGPAISSVISLASIGEKLRAGIWHDEHLRLFRLVTPWITVSLHWQYRRRTTRLEMEGKKKGKKTEGERRHSFSLGLLSSFSLFSLLGSIWPFSPVSPSGPSPFPSPPPFVRVSPVTSPPPSRPCHRPLPPALRTLLAISSVLPRSSHLLPPWPLPAPKSPAQAPVVPSPTLRLPSLQAQAPVGSKFSRPACHRSFLIYAPQ